MIEQGVREASLARIVTTTRHQHGSVAIIVALSLAVLVGMIGLAIDLGRMYVIKTELQNAADACALAAAQELDGNPGAKERADAAGIWVGTRNKTNFQHAPAIVRTINVTYSSTLSDVDGDNSNYGRSISDADAKFVMCTVSQPSINMLFMNLMGFASRSVNAYAVASLVPSQAPCTIPLGYCMGHPGEDEEPTICSDGTYPDRNGLCIGAWSSGKFNAGSGESSSINGAFNWLDFPYDSGNGAPPLKEQLIEGYCKGLEGETVDAETGDMAVLATYWNTRFGLYKKGAGNPQFDVPPYAIPDLTGFSYTPTNWPSQHSAYSDFVTHRPTNDPYQGDEGPNATGLKMPGAFDPNPDALAAGAIDRRVVPVPLVDCKGWDSGHKTYSGRYACVLMLHPIANPTDVVYLEYLGEAGPGSTLCPTGGLPGVGGAEVPGLVQ